MYLSIWSSSSWGCELKYLVNNRQELIGRHPLREDVSWNNHLFLYIAPSGMSSSSWGCELKYWLLVATIYPWKRHPLREDVSWNISRLKTSLPFNVILFVRMWVEIIQSVLLPLRPQVVILFVRMWVEIRVTQAITCSTKSSSSWGCELKYQHRLSAYQS